MQLTSHRLLYSMRAKDDTFRITAVPRLNARIGAQKRAHTDAHHPFVQSYSYSCTCMSTRTCTCTRTACESPCPECTPPAPQTLGMHVHRGRTCRRLEGGAFWRDSSLRFFPCRMRSRSAPPEGFPLCCTLHLSVKLIFSFAMRLRICMGTDAGIAGQASHVQG